jgi:hypothetical protein
MRPVTLPQAVVWFLSLMSSMALYLSPLSHSVLQLEPGWRRSMFHKRHHNQLLEKRGDTKYVFMHHVSSRFD